MDGDIKRILLEREDALDLPITEAMNGLLAGEGDAKTALHELMNLQIKVESEL